MSKKYSIYFCNRTTGKEDQIFNSWYGKDNLIFNEVKAYMEADRLNNMAKELAKATNTEIQFTFKVIELADNEQESWE